MVAVHPHVRDFLGLVQIGGEGKDLRAGQRQEVIGLERLAISFIDLRAGDRGIVQIYPTTPDGRYFVVRGLLWRTSNPALDPMLRERLVGELMDARRAVGAAKRTGDRVAEKAAHDAVGRAKIALGERGPVWWDDGAPDLNRHLAGAGPYADWYSKLSKEDD